MVKRLVDEADAVGADRQLADLFRSVAPFEVDPFSKRRILVRLERGMNLRTSSARFWVRPIVIAALLVSGTATAALGHRYVLHGSGFFGLGGSPSATSSNTSVAPALARRAPSAKLAAGNQLAPVEVAPTAAAPSAAVLPEPTPSAPVPRSGSKSSRSRPESSEDATHVVQAIQALRTERDPARAQALLNDYLEANPRGALSGDALALSIEAASAQHDPRAAEFARRYLAAYPKGKYRELAKRALESKR